MAAQVQFDHYELLTRSDGSPFELGRGAMGITYKAYDTNLRIPVALKVINGPGLQNELARTRFVQEARAAARLRHRHVASVFHLGVDGESYYYAMEFIDGETVECLVKRGGPLPELVALRIALQVSRALHAAEQHGLVHRDIKPSNLMLVHEDDELCAKVIDFGLAQSRMSDEETAAAPSGSTSHGFVGTPHYASPEQLEEKEIDGRSDIYSLGCTLWYMLSGEPPFNGPVARIVSEHLTAEPPFERLDGIAEPVIAILRKTLMKNPAERYQSAADLRQEIEQTIQAMAGGPAAAAARMALEEARVIPPSALEKEAGELTVGSRVAERYEILATLGATNTGWLYHARDLESGADVRLVLLDQSFSQDRAAFTSLEGEIVNLQNVEHPNLLRVYGIESVGSRAMLVLEWTTGVTLLQVLRTRRELESDEVLRLLEPMAAGADEAAELSLKRLEISLHQVYVHFPGGLENEETLLRIPVNQWPEWNLKLNPLAITRELSQSQTWAGGQTLVGGGSAYGEAGSAEGERSYTRELAVLVYELLGGAMTPTVAAKASSQGLTRISPLSNLTEQGNDVLRQALHPTKRFAQAKLFHRALINVGALEAQYGDATPAAAAGGVQSPPSPGRSAARFPGTTGRKRPSRTSPMVFAGIAILLVAAVGAYILFIRPKGLTVADSPTLTEEPGTTPDVTPSDDHPGGVTTDPVVPIVPRATPAPNARELLLVATSKAEGIEANSDIPAALDAWLQVAREFPEAVVGRMRLEVLLDSLPFRGKPEGEAELAKLEPEIREAAKLDVVSAQMLLGEMLRSSNPTESFNWFSAAAAKGVPTAMTQVALMLSNGVGVERNLQKAVEIFLAAAEKGEAGAKAALGELYLGKKGIEQDLPKAISFLEQAAAKNNPFANDRLGNCYRDGIGVKQDFGEAFKYFTKAANLGLAASHGNIAVLYMRGEGQTINPKKAIQHIQKGLEVNDPFCMYLYGLCLEGGNGVTANPGEARSMYIKAARGGNKAAITRCRELHIEY